MNVAIKLSRDGMDGYIVLTPPNVERRSKRNQVIEVQDKTGMHQGTLVLDFDDEDHLVGIELNGCHRLLQARFVDFLRGSNLE